MTIEQRASAMLPSADLDTVGLHRASEMPMSAIRWLWRDYLALGKLHVLAGPPGSGKTTAAMAMVATTTCAGRWPDGTRATVGNALIWSGEDDPADTLIPRLVAAGANLERVFFVGYTRIDGQSRSFDPATDLPLLMAEADRIGGVSIVIVDPIVSAVAGDSHKNGEVRRALQPVVDMAAALDAAVLGISHFSKGSAGRDPTERVTGSIAFGALARVVLVAAKRDNAETGGSRMLARAKSNIGPDGGGFGYDLCMVDIGNGIEASRVEWGAALEGSARQLLGEAEAMSDSPRDEAADWLTDMLAVCPVQVTTLRTEAKEAGLSWRTVERAKTEIGVIASRSSIGNGGRGCWVWTMPGKPATATPPALPQDLAVLRNANAGAGFSGSKPARPPDFESGGVGGLESGVMRGDAA